MTDFFIFSSIMFAFTRLVPYLGVGFSDCVLFGAIISATDPGRHNDYNNDIYVMLFMISNH